jgi:hypothetical protein
MKIAKLAMLLASLTVAGCAATPPNVLPDFNPADPAMGLRETRYPGVINYTHREPVDPQNWRQQNDRLSPANPGGQS